MRSIAASLGLTLCLLAGCRGTDTRPPQNPPGPGKVATVDPEPALSIEEILGGSDLPEPLPSPLPSDAMGVSIHRLSNGMTVYVSTDRQQPRFTAWVGVRAGSRMDPADSTGLAHYLEHMLFKGTDEFGTLDMEAEQPHIDAVAALYRELRATDDPAQREAILAKVDAQTQAQGKYAIPNEIDRMYASIGVEGVNAFTSDEETVYIGSVPSNRLAQWSAIEAERYTNPVYRLFWPELEAVYEEKNLDLDSPSSRAWYAMLRGLFPEHPYGNQTTIGEVEHLKSPAYDDMAAYFERWYVPNNMAIVLAGDIDAATAIPALEKAFGHLHPRPVPVPPPAELPPVAGRQVREVLGDGEPGVRIAWQSVPVGHPDEAALAVLDRVLDDASVGRLNTQLELTQRLPAVGSGYSTFIEAGYFYVWAQARQEQSLDDVEAMLRDVVAQVRSGKVRASDVEAAKLHWSLARKEALESSSARASRMMDAFVTHRPWDEVVAYEEAVEAVTAQDVVRVANAYLGEDSVVVFKRNGQPELPTLDKPSITPVPIDPSRKSPFFERIEGMDAPQLQPVWAEEGTHYERRALPGGELIAARNPRNDLFSVTIRIKRGYRKAPLLCYALDLFELSGRGETSAEDLQKELYALGSSVWTRCDAEYSSITMEGLEENLEPTVALVRSWLDDPTFSPALLDRHLSNTLSARKDQLDKDQYLTAALDAYAKYGERSAWKVAPSNAALAAAKPKALRSLIRTMLDHRGRTLYFGTRTPDDAAALLGIPKTSKGRTRFRDPGDAWVRTFRPLEGPTVYFLHKEVAKANVRFAFPAAPLARDERPLATLYSHVLSGNMSAAVFQELRESSGLAYSASARVSPGRTPKDASALFGSLSTQTDKTPDALARFMALLRSPPLSQARVEEARESLDHDYRATRLDPRYVGWNVVAWDERGEASDPRPWEWAQVMAAEATTLETFAAAWTDAPAVFAVVGDRARVGMDALKALGTVHEVERETLFGYGPFPGS
ncbi:MAG: M16 family metallopeptidase [Nannocystaceae bacterium]|nr:insulinase family protein [bacterium]